MNKNEKAFLANLIRTMEHKRRKNTCEYCYELLFELKFLQNGNITDFQARQMNLINDD